MPWLSSTTTVRCIVRDAVGKFCWDAHLLYGTRKAGQCCVVEGAEKAKQMHQQLVQRGIHALALAAESKTADSCTVDSVREDAQANASGNEQAMDSKLERTLIPASADQQILERYQWNDELVPGLPDPDDYIDKDFELVRDPLDQVCFRLIIPYTK